MEKQIARFFAKKLLTFNTLEKTNINTLAFGFELLITSAFGILIMVVISVITHHYLAWLFFLLGFAPLRTTAGGYHASTHLRCYVISSIIFAFCLFLAINLPLFSYQYLVLTFVITTIIVIFSPVPANNKPLTEEGRLKNRKRSIGISFTVFIISLALCLMGVTSISSAIFFWGSASASASLVIAKAINKFTRGGKL